MEPGAKIDEPAQMMTTTTVSLDEEEWKVLIAMKEELEPHEIIENPWDQRAETAGVELRRFLDIAKVLNLSLIHI